ETRLPLFQSQGRIKKKSECRHGTNSPHTFVKRRKKRVTLLLFALRLFCVEYTSCATEIINKPTLCTLSTISPPPHSTRRDVNVSQESQLRRLFFLFAPLLLECPQHGQCNFLPGCDSIQLNT
ncbi:unnamed protein product, partial [Ectocarpus sp. 4 AP-2014]